MAWVRRELDALGIPPLKRFGQHFLVDKNVREKMIELAELTPDDTVLEIGPGLGFLTAALSQKAGRVIAIEKDRTLAAYLTNKFSKHKNLTIIQGDVFNVDLPEYTKIVSSPPYNISSKLILFILRGRAKISDLLLQDEFVTRLTASSGSRDYGRLSIMLQCRAQAKFIAKVERSAFYPKPKVDSALVTILPARHEPPIKNPWMFEDVVRALFTQRKRLLRGVLARYLKDRYPSRWREILQRVSLLEKRIFEVSPQELIVLSNQIIDIATELGIERESSAS